MWWNYNVPPLFKKKLYGSDVSGTWEHNLAYTLTCKTLILAATTLRRTFTASWLQLRVNRTLHRVCALVVCVHDFRIHFSYGSTHDNCYVLVMWEHARLYFNGNFRDRYLLYNTTYIPYYIIYYIYKRANTRTRWGYQ